MKWFRYYHEALDDPRIQRLDGNTFKFWVNLLCLASRAKDRGTLPPIGDIAFALRLDERRAQSMMNTLEKAGLIRHDDGACHYPADWEGTQRQSDNVATRVQKHRTERKKSPDVTLHETGDRVTGNVLDTDTDTDKSTPLPPKENESAKEETKAERDYRLKFWLAYPSAGRNRSSKRQVEVAWNAINPDADKAREILNGLEAWKNSAEWKKDGGQFVMGAHRFLTTRKFEELPLVTELVGGPPGPPPASNAEWHYGYQRWVFN